MRFYFDSSALAKRYIQEKGSDLIEGFFLQAESVVVSSIYFPEIISVFARLRREKKLTDHEYALCKRAAAQDFQAFEVCPLSPEAVSKSVSILERSDLRAMDAIQVASAIEARVSKFVSGDKKQIIAAKQFGLKVETV